MAQVAAGQAGEVGGGTAQHRWEHEAAVTVVEPVLPDSRRRALRLGRSGHRPQRVAPPLLRASERDMSTDPEFP
eukprot:COSAG01_NODE_303_length_19167_cov_10.792454_3_plen_74_part_00